MQLQRRGATRQAVSSEYPMPFPPPCNTSCCRTCIVEKDGMHGRRSGNHRTYIHVPEDCSCSRCT
ncbi:hypothetical protein DOTSEDRAFT_75741 [Dothistroma septosporum NZE10]|uniref:Uncharacterized protein n=1 Tax=Dothistroma septosporum (strain NZE10 / CBS 128990) TaxID=675120 RepID=N1PCX9_DOTSN|nr:hypothetical protein DOTSEDRAFT_75741 [Dothistroma septosporum NZE10]